MRQARLGAAAELDAGGGDAAGGVGGVVGGGRVPQVDRDVEDRGVGRRRTAGPTTLRGVPNSSMETNRPLTIRIHSGSVLMPQKDKLWVGMNRRKTTTLSGSSRTTWLPSAAIEPSAFVARHLGYVAVKATVWEGDENVGFSGSMVSSVCVVKFCPGRMYRRSTADRRGHRHGPNFSASASS